MSFILDALKKSENARQRQAGPALFEVKVTPPRRALPVWAMIIGVLLAINVVALSWVLLRHHGVRTQPVTRTAPAATHVTPTRHTPAHTATAVTSAGATRGLSPAATPASNPAAEAKMTPPAPAAGATRRGAGAAAIPAAAQPNPSDFAPAVQPAPAGTGSGARAAGGLPLYAQIAAAPGNTLPRLHLDLHVYDPNPSKRFVMINMRKLHQGNSLADGVTVVKIRPDGVVLSYQGRKFLLPR